MAVVGEIFNAGVVLVGTLGCEVGCTLDRVRSRLGCVLTWVRSGLGCGEELLAIGMSEKPEPLSELGKMEAVALTSVEVRAAVRAAEVRISSLDATISSVLLEEPERVEVVGFGCMDSPCELVGGNLCELVEATCMLDNEGSLLCKLVEATGESNALVGESSNSLLVGEAMTCMLDDGSCELVEGTGEANTLVGESLLVEEAIVTCMLDDESCELAEGTAASPCELVEKMTETCVLDGDGCELVEGVANDGERFALVEGAGETSIMLDDESCEVV